MAGAQTSINALTDPLNGDRPIEDAAQDLLGFLPMAQSLAGAIRAQTATPGLVIGLEGAWGAGKSSLLNLTREALRAGTVGDPIKVIEFRPWLIGSRDQLMTALLTDLSKAFEEIEKEQGNLAKSSVRAVKHAGEALREFTSSLTGLGKAVELAGLILPGAQVGGLAIQNAADAARQLSRSPSLVRLKREAETALAKLDAPIVITIDDLDRLEPPEAVEVLRLVRSVADLPNLVYILCYDHSVLADAVRRAAEVDDGSAYLEKIIQIVVETPAPEPYDLRAWFGRELAELSDHCRSTRPPDSIRSSTGRAVDASRHPARWSVPSTV